MALKSLTVRNFQKHKKLRLDLDRYVTTIVGPTDAGKTAIIRALRMIFFNKPAKDRYIRHGANSMSASLEVDKHRISRKKGRGKNLYFLDGEVYKSFGANAVPANISKILNVSQVNFQNQLDVHYWFGDSASQVSRNLNQIVSLEIIDKSLSNAAAIVRRSKAEEDICLQRFEKAKHRKRELSWVPEFCAGVERLGLIKQAHEKAAEKVRSLAFIVSELKRHNKTLGTLTTLAQTGEKALSAGTRATVTRRKVNDLQSIIGQLRKADKISDVEFPNFDSLLNLRIEGDRLAERRRELEILCDEISIQSVSIKSLGRELASAKLELKKARPKVCPTCGRSLQLPSETSTCPQKHRSLGQRRKTGWR